MKIAISATDGSLEADLDPRFGRTAFFIVVNPDSLENESYPNPNLNASGGAGIQSAQFVLGKGAEAVITGSCGPNAFRVLQAAGVPVFEGVQGSVQEMIQAYKNGQLVQVDQPTGGHKRRRSVAGNANLPNERSSSGSDSNRKEIRLIKDEISNMEARLVELNRKLEQMDK